MSAGFDAFFDRVVAQLPGYEPRPQQREMARAVLDAIESGGQTIVEAGTGSGKSFAYLLPAIYAGKRVVISTGTIQLQEQILEKDLPFLLKTSGEARAVALAKGRGNYLCRQKLWEADRHIGPKDPLRAEVERLLEATSDWDGDLAELPYGVDPRFWSEVASTSDDCLGARCEYFEQNPFRLARVKLGKADLIIANHALYLVDLASGGQILPDHDVVLFDEAHHLPRVASQAFTATIGRYALTKLMQKIRRRWQPVPDRLAFAFVDLEAKLADWIFKQERAQFRLYPDRRFLDIAEQMMDHLDELLAWLEQGTPHELLFTDEQLASKAPLHRQKLVTQLQNLIGRWAFFAHQAGGADTERVNWVEVNQKTGYFELLSAPIDVSKTLAETLWAERAAVLTSATLSVGGDFGYFKRQLGLPEETLTRTLPSPFDFPAQAKLYLPGLPEPNDPRYEAESHAMIERLIRANQGASFVLFTSYRAMKQAYEALEPHLPYPCAAQGELGRSKLIAWFKGTPGAVLFATASFWEGVDVPGPALSCVIIDRLPFAVPDDPLVQAYVDRLKQQGRDWFREFTLPEAILKLKQGFGRLIRTATDTGVVAILDARLTTKTYGRQIVRALPPCERVTDFERIAAFMAERRAGAAALGS